MGHQLSVTQCCEEIMHDDYIGTCENCGLSVCGWCVVNGENVERNTRFPALVYPFTNEDGELIQVHCCHCNQNTK